MQRWEYMVLQVFEDLVLTVNGKNITKPPTEGRGIIDKAKNVVQMPKGPPLHIYLNHLGTYGWDVIGMTPVSGKGDMPGGIQVMVVLKRPME